MRKLIISLFSFPSTRSESLINVPVNPPHSLPPHSAVCPLPRHRLPPCRAVRMSDPAWQRVASRGMRAWLGAGGVGAGKGGGGASARPAERRTGGGAGRSETVLAMAERSVESARDGEGDVRRSSQQPRPPSPSPLVSPLPVASASAPSGADSGRDGAWENERTGKRRGGGEGGMWRWRGDGAEEEEKGEREGLMGEMGDGGWQQGRKQEYERLFSNLNEVNMKHEPGSLVSSTLLVAGTTVGAGILALPAVTSEAGFLPSCATCIVCWLYMVATGMLIAEVNVNTMCELGSGGVSLVSMAQRTLGTAGVRIAGTTYLLIHYAVITAYVSRSADIISSAAAVPHGLAASLFTISFGALCYFGSQRAIGLVNGMLVAGIVLSFAFLLAFSLADIHPQALLAANIAAVPASVPIIALSFVYQNVVPVVATNLEGNLPRIRTAILAGTALPLLMFLLWDAAILGTAPIPPPPQPLVDALAMASDAAAATAPSAAVAAAEAMKVVDPLARLQQIDPSVGGAVQLFSFFAIATSYIGFILGLSDFLADGTRATLYTLATTALSHTISPIHLLSSHDSPLIGPFCPSFPPHKLFHTFLPRATAPTCLLPNAQFPPTYFFPLYLLSSPSLPDPPPPSSTQASIRPGAHPSAVHPHTRPAARLLPLQPRPLLYRSRPCRHIRSYFPSPSPLVLHSLFSLPPLLASPSSPVSLPPLHPSLPHLPPLPPPYLLSLIIPSSTTSFPPLPHHSLLYLFSPASSSSRLAVLVLFGILPAAMAWVDRASLRPVTDQPRLVPGGNVTLTLIIGFALTIITNEFASNFIH
ncbi:unnamed protein product [Closterium sp. Naga37s-1]|nr:unnamed protein product [Closterium sp. Naga37s-1]